MDARDLARMMVILGAVLALTGLIWMNIDRVPALRILFGHLGRLPGDIAIERDGFRVTIPLATSLLLSILVSAVLWVLRALRNGSSG